MTSSSFSLRAAVAALLAVAIVAAAQGPQAPAPAAGKAAPPPPEHAHPAPTNLKVLPKNLTAEQVHDIMHGWRDALGVTCGTCHAENPKDIGPNGRPRLNYADDSKPEKNTARTMYKMTEEINVNFISKIDSSGEPVTCGTCHRGHMSPEPFDAAEEKHPAAPAEKKPQPK